MGLTERRDRQKMALRQEILTAARELFAKEGYENVSMRRIAEKIEYSPTTIYLYFRDKDELLHEMCSETFALLTRKLTKLLAADGDPLDKLRMGLNAYVQFGLKHPNHYFTTFMQPTPKCGEVGEYEGSAGAEAFGKLVEGVTACVHAGRFRETDVLAISQSLWMVIHGITSLLISFGEGFPFVERDRLIDLTIENALRGWAA
jgi:AcrR family transcriptional regulator